MTQTSTRERAEKIDLDFILRDCNGDIAAAQRRIDRVLLEVRKEALELIAKNFDQEAEGFDYNSKNSLWSKLLRQKAAAIRALAAGKEGK